MRGLIVLCCLFAAQAPADEAEIRAVADYLGLD
jgi:hypothetical protein